MRILHVVPTYLPAVRYGGPIYSVHGLCKALVQLGHEVHVFTTNVDGDGNSDVPLGIPVELDGVQVWYFSSGVGRRLYWSPAMFQQLKKSIRDFDLVHLHSVFLWPTWAAARLARKYEVPYVLAPRGMLVKELISRKSRWLKSAWIRLIETRNIENAALIHATAQLEQDEFEIFGFQQKNICIVPNGVESPQKFTAADISDDIRDAIRKQPYLLFLGRLNWKKGLDRLLEALCVVADANLLIVGNDEEDYLKTIRNLVRENALEDRVTIIPRFVSGTDKETLFANATLFVLPSYSENFGNTVPEAMARGCPVVVSQEVGAAELVREAGGGIVTDEEHLSASLSRLVQDKAYAKNLGMAGKEWVATHLSWRQVAKNMLHEYQRLLKIT